MVNFHQNLASLRKSKGFTQQQLADLIGIQPRLISRWEQNKSRPKLDYIIQLADTLEVSVDFLLKGTENKTIAPLSIRNKKLKELCQLADKLKKEKQEVICRFLDMAIRHEQMKEINTLR